MLADDTNISASADCVDELKTKSNVELSNIFQWLVVNKLTLNVSKTEYMIIGCCHKLNKINIDPIIEIGEDYINRVKTTKSHGMVIEDKLKWGDHIENRKQPLYFLYDSDFNLNRHW